jgi:hypothetical protein
MSGTIPLHIEALTALFVAGDMVAHGVSINQNHDIRRDPPLAVRCDGPWLDKRLATGLTSWLEVFPVPAGVALP